jgi:multiple sugar transport system ATP-binding protein
MSDIEVKNLTVTYPAKKRMEYVCIDSLDASFPSGNVNVILGESGSGKSTLLKALAGILNYEGDIYFDGMPARKLSPKEKNIAFVNQEITLYPNRTIFDNLALPLRLFRFKPDEIRGRVYKIAKELGILATLSRLPRQISIGQQQRACLGKALIKEPNVLLLDEPFSNIDPKRREEERKLLRGIVKEKGLTVILATHLEEDVLSLGDEVFLLEGGKISLALKKEELSSSPHPLIRAMMASHIGGNANG